MRRMTASSSRHGWEMSRMFHCVRGRLSIMKALPPMMPKSCDDQTGNKRTKGGDPSGERCSYLNTAVSNESSHTRTRSCLPRRLPVTQWTSPSGIPTDPLFDSRWIIIISVYIFGCSSYLKDPSQKYMYQV